MPGPVFKTGEGSGNRLLVGSIPMRSATPEGLRVFAFDESCKCSRRLSAAFGESRTDACR